MAYSYHSNTVFTSATSTLPRPPYSPYSDQSSQSNHQQGLPARHMNLPRQGTSAYYHNSENETSAPPVNMAGFGARQFTQRQEEARRRVEREQQMLEEQHRTMQAEERYYHAQRAHQEQQARWQEEQQQMQRGTQQRPRDMASTSSPLLRSTPLHKQTGSLSPSLRELRLQDTSRPSMTRSATQMSSASSDGFWFPSNRSASGHAPSASASSTSSGASRLRLPQQAFARETVYEDDYEEPAEDVDDLESDGFGGMKPKVRHSALTRSGSEEQIPLAKCADCGDSLPFEELVGHSCISLSECKSPLFTRSGPPTPLTEVAPEMVRGGSAPSRSPFLERYAEVVGKNSSPLLQSTTLPLSSNFPPREWVSAKDSPVSNTLTVTSVVDNASSRVEQLRKDRIRQIEEQRAAKKMQSSKGIPDDSPQSNQRQFERSKHTREPGSLSSSSVSSRKSSLLRSSRSYMEKSTPPTAEMTPSSSFERMDSHLDYKKSLEKAKPLAKERSVKKAGVDIGGIESLLEDIDRDAAIDGKTENKVIPRARSSGKGTRPSGLNLTNVSRSERMARKTCSVCLRVFPKSQPMVEKGGKIFCIDDYAELYLEKCGKCTRPVRDVGVRSQDGALSGLYHRDCFSCFRCNAAFDDGTFYVYENAPYCSKHYHYLNGTTCHSCKQGIEGKCRQLETGERFHPRCLTCQYDNGKEFCKDILTDYYLIKDKRLCEWHFEKVQKHLHHSDTEGSAAAAARLKASKRRTIFQTLETRKGKA